MLPSSSIRSIISWFRKKWKKLPKMCENFNGIFHVMQSQAHSLWLLFSLIIMFSSCRTFYKRQTLTPTSIISELNCQHEKKNWKCFCRFYREFYVILQIVWRSKFAIYMNLFSLWDSWVVWESKKTLFNNAKLPMYDKWTIIEINIYLKQFEVAFIVRIQFVWMIGTFVVREFLILFFKSFLIFWEWVGIILMIFDTHMSDLN